MPETIVIEIETENDAFTPDPYPEVARILREIADSLGPGGHLPSVLRDVNGNRIGRCTTRS